MKPKVLVGCPTSYYKEYCFDEYLDAVKNLSYDNYDILLVDNSENNDYFDKIKKKLPVIKGPYDESARERIVLSRNILKDKAIEKYDYLLSLEQDVIPPKNIIELFLEHNKKVVSGIYFNRDLKTRELIPLAYIELPEKSPEGLPSMRTLNDSEMLSNNLIKIVSCGTGCVLIHKDILKKISFRYEKNKDAFDDRFFGIDLFRLKEPMYCDTRVKCKHLILNRPFLWRNIKK
jgi:GT2 family glycosyltransferase